PASGGRQEPRRTAASVRAELESSAMATNAETAYESIKGNVGLDNGTGDWFEVTQELINQFADVTHDHQFIHVDPERAAAGPFGTTIAHGFLTLSLLVHLQGSLKGGDERPAPN